MSLVLLRKLSSNAVTLEPFIGRKCTLDFVPIELRLASPDTKCASAIRAPPFLVRSSFYSRERDLPTPLENARKWRSLCKLKQTPKASLYCQQPALAGRGRRTLHEDTKIRTAMAQALKVLPESNYSLAVEAASRAAAL
jgi:hypothetical protein